MDKMSNTALNKIGDIIRTRKRGASYEAAVEVLNNWREAHGAILDYYYDRCVDLSNRIDQKHIIVTQRLKRLPTIIGKLNRFKNMRLFVEIQLRTQLQHVWATSVETIDVFNY